MFLNEIYQGLKLIGNSLIAEPNVWWFLTPVFILWIVMEVYFGQYKGEKIGWNSILANGISFAWINIASFRVLFLENSSAINFQLRLLILSIFLLYSIFIIYTAFTHKLRERIGALLAGPTTIYSLSTISVLWGQGLLAINIWVLINFVILYLIIYSIFLLIKKKLGVMGEVEAINRGEDL